jgi:hypothetical protein
LIRWSHLALYLFAAAVFACGGAASEQSTVPTLPCTNCRTTVPVEEAQRLLGSKLLLPRYVPAGLVAPSAVQVSLDGSGQVDGASFEYVPQGDLREVDGVDAVFVDESFGIEISYLPSSFPRQDFGSVEVITRSNRGSLEATWKVGDATYDVRVIEYGADSRPNLRDVASKIVESMVSD